MVMAPSVSVMQSAKSKRIPRRPTHTFNLATRPFGIYPFMLAPVLPGETMKNLSLQSRVVTDPIVGKLVGWWKEYYFFYVKLRDLPTTAANAVETMLLDPAASIAAALSSADAPQYYFTPGVGNAIPWAQYCMERVVECYFRDQDEAWNTQTIDGVPKAKFNGTDWSDSVFRTTELPTSSTLGATAEEFHDFEQRWRNWSLLRQQMLTDMTFEDYLATFGVHVPAPGKGKPEVLRFIREWTYPVNTVEPTTGVPTSAVSWSVTERADKDRFFTEPGFIFGVTVTRPKCYRKLQIQNASVMLDRAQDWMPALLRDDPSSSLKEVLGANPANSPYGTGVVNDLFIDVRDLYVHGDQWLYSPSPITDVEGDAHSLDSVGSQHYQLPYATDASINKLFADRTPATKIYVREDGIVNLNILGTQIDYT